MSIREPRQEFKKSALVVAVSAACAGVNDAHAQDAIEEIIVTATKRAVSIQDVPMSITAFGNEEIVRQGFKQLEDYAGQIPALSYGVRQPGGANVIMRGCAVSGIAFSDNPTTAIYLDEQPITVAGFNPDPRLVDIARVEALSGPQGTLFGDASQCGTLRIITNKPDPSEFEGFVDLDVANVNHGGTGYDISMMVNAPLIEDKLGFRIVGFVNEEAGYVDNIFGVSPGKGQFPGGTFDNTEFVQKDINTESTIGGRAALRWYPTEEWTVDIGAIYQKLVVDGFSDTDLPENFLEGRDLGEWQQIRYEDDNFEDAWYQLALTVEGSLGWADFVIAGSFMNRETSYEADATAYLGAWQERYPNLAIYDFLDQDPRAKAFDVGETDRTSVELRLATPSDSDSRWSGILGVFYNDVENHTLFASNVKDLDQTGLTVPPPGPPGCGAHCYLNYYAFYYNCGTAYSNDCIDPVAPSNNWWTGVYDSTLEQIAVFGEASFDISDNFSITAGGRWFEIDTERQLEQSTLVGGLQDYRTLGRESICSGSTGDLCYQSTAGKSSESGFVPKVTFTYNLDDDRMFYTTYSEGFRRGGGNSARPRSIFGRPPFNQFESDLVKNFEVGAKTSWASGRMQINITAYHMVWENIQIEAEDPTPKLFTLGVLNFPEAEIDGVELFWAWSPSDRWDISASLGANNAELSEDAALVVDGAPVERSAAKGTPLPLTPDIKASLSVEHYFDAHLLGGQPFASISIQHTGDSVSSLSGIQSIEFDNPVRQQAAYTLVNLRFGLESDEWSATLYINNALDEYASLFYNDRWAQTRLSVNRPRTIGLNFRVNF